MTRANNQEKGFFCFYRFLDSIPSLTLRYLTFETLPLVTTIWNRVVAIHLKRTFLWLMISVQLQPANILISGTIFDCLIPRDGISDMPITTKREGEHFTKPMASSLSSLFKELRVRAVTFVDDLTPREAPHNCNSE